MNLVPAKLVVATILLATALTGTAEAISAGKPNIVLIISDDQGYGDFSIHGNPSLQTPNIDALAKTSVRFDRFYVNSFCAPTRAALLTGRYPLRTGCHGVTHNREAMRASEVTLAEVLQQAGYRTACIGKWHNGEQFPLTPQGQGFDESFGFNNGHWNAYFNPVLLRNSQPEQTSGYVSDTLTDEAIRFVTSNKSRPFFCYLSFNAPHSPFQVPDRYFDKYQNLGFDSTVAAFYGMCENLDDNVARLLSHLEAQGLDQNTIVLFLTDNGGTAGVKTYNANMRGGKTSVHEGGCRVPLFIRWPAAKWQPHIVRPIASHIDLMPTLLDLCGISVPNGIRLDGVSLAPLLRVDADQGWPERILFTHNPINESNKFPGAVRTQKYRLVREIQGPAGGSNAKADDASASPWQLFDMDDDPSQKKDISSIHPNIVSELSQRYEIWFEDISRDALQRLPLPLGHSEQNPVEYHAPQAYFDKPIQFASGPGFANDWLTSWTSVESKVWFELLVEEEGEYAIELAYGCPTADAGSRIRVAIGDQSLECTVAAAESPEVPLPHRDEKGKSRYRNRLWATLAAGKLKLPRGPAILSITPLSMPGMQVMDIKHVKLTRQHVAPVSPSSESPN